MTVFDGTSSLILNVAFIVFVCQFVPALVAVPLLVQNKFVGHRYITPLAVSIEVGA